MVGYWNLLFLAHPAPVYYHRPFFQLVQVWTFVDILTGVASILNLTAVSVCRYVEVMRPYTSQEIITKTRVSVSLLLVWLFAASTAALKAMIPRRTNLWIHSPGYQLLIFLVSFVIPLIGISYCYFNMFKEVSRHRSNLLKVSSSCTNELVIDVKVIKTIAIVVVVFFICWCPFFVTVLVNGFCKCVRSVKLVTFVKLLHYSNSAFNPNIYVWYNEKFRQAFTSWLIKIASHYGFDSLATFLKKPGENDISRQSSERRYMNSPCSVISQTSLWAV